ncbi:MAG: tripartite tricarboxylate transporter substrate binding protein [Burkholderiaceae bacterium]
MDVQQPIRPAHALRMPACAPRRRFVFAGGALVAAAAMPRTARAQGWPNKPIRIVCAQAPGSSVDSMARAFGEYFAGELKVPIIIENKPGGVGMIAAEMVAHSAPDGNTLLFTLHSQLAQAPVLLKKVPIDTSNDLVPISAVSPGTGAFVVRKGLPVATYPEFVEFARTRPVSIGNYGAGSGWQLQLLELIRQTSMQIDIVTYRGTGPMMVDLNAGQIDGGSGSLVGLAPALQAGNVKPLVVTTGRRSNKLPGIPTWADVGVHGDAFSYLVEMNMFLAAAGTAPDVVERLAGLTHDAVARSDKLATVRDLAGADDTPVTGDELRKLIADSWPAYRNLTQKLGLSVG